jgi:hypothetical protein
VWRRDSVAPVAFPCDVVWIGGVRRRGIIIRNYT